MTDAEFRKAQARVLKAYRRWHSPTGMASWIVCHAWHRDGTDGEDAKGAARCQCSWEYMTVTFHWNLACLADHTDHEIDRAVRHEICHALVHEMREWGPELMPSDESARRIKHEERVVSALSFVLLWCSESGNKRIRDPKKKNK